MSIYSQLLNHKTKMAIIGLGYVGMPIAVAFARKIDVIGFDIDQDKIDIYRSGIDPTREVGDDVIAQTTVLFTSDEVQLQSARFFIVAVPTPVKPDNTPDLTPVVGASEIIGRNLKPGSIVVYESTVYPGVTEEVCIPILEKESGLLCGTDFKVGYSPERINPGDKINRLESIVKIVSGMDAESLDLIADVYSLVIEAGVHKASSIKVAEAAKVVENSQRDINIAFMNELAMVFDRMNIDTLEVIKAMNTKWNALRFTPGLVGGHCIGVDPYYFIYQAEKLGYHSQIILSGRKINNGMGAFVADAIIKQLILADKNVKRAKIAILGITFKENCPDIRNSKVRDIIDRLAEFGVAPIVSDPEADPEEVFEEYSISLTPIEDITGMDCIVFAVAHDYYRNLNGVQLSNLFAGNKGERVLVDVKGVFDQSALQNDAYRVWRL